jgi:hypothetical protein
MPSPVQQRATRCFVRRIVRGGHYSSDAYLISKAATGVCAPMGSDRFHCNDALIYCLRQILPGRQCARTVTQAP